MIEFRTPTDQERAFLQIATARYPELQGQIESCEVADYDPDGYMDVRVLTGPPSLRNTQLQGPILETGLQTTPSIETILWTDDQGMLYKIEFLIIGAPLHHIYRRFIMGEVQGKVRYDATQMR